MFEFMNYLKKEKIKGETIFLHENFFFENSFNEIKNLEKYVTYPIPSQLKQFFSEVGWGQLQTGRNGTVADGNYVASPAEIIKILDGTSDWLMPYSQIEPNVLPFFQRNVDFFLCLKPYSENPNAVHFMWGDLMPNKGKICDSLVEFFERLVEDPNWFSHPLQE